MHAQIEELAERLRRQIDETVALVEGLDDETFYRRPAEGRWAVAEHLAHLPRSTEPYARAMEAGVERARRKGWTATGADFRGTWFGRTFVGVLEPPPKRRVKTFGTMVPPPLESIGRDEALADFRRAQETLVDVLEGGDGLDLGRAKIASPFMPTFLLPLRLVVRFSVFEGGLICAAHTDRHLWLVRETLEQMEVGVP